MDQAIICIISTTQVHDNWIDQSLTMSDEDIFSNLPSPSELLTTLTDDDYNDLPFDFASRESSSGDESDNSSSSSSSSSESDSSEDNEEDDAGVFNSTSGSLSSNNSNNKGDDSVDSASSLGNNKILGNNDHGTTDRPGVSEATCPVEKLDIGTTDDYKLFSSNELLSKEEETRLSSQNAKLSPAINMNMSSQPSGVMDVTQNATQKSSLFDPKQAKFIIPHRGCLRRILNASSLSDNSPGHSPRQSHSQPAKENVSCSPGPSSSWPIYVISVYVPDAPLQNSLVSNHHQHHYDPHSPHSNPQFTKSQTPHNMSNTMMQQQQQFNPQPIRYNVIFDRQQYEFCTRLFALLDTECQTLIGPECIRDFIKLHCPMVRRRDEAILSRRRRERQSEEESICEDDGNDCESPTFDEIWRSVLCSDPRTAQLSVLPLKNYSEVRIGLEGWMLFCRLLSLAQHQESQRRFASRHLQQMMRHKHGGGGSRGNEVVVMVDNPPPGPPVLISLGGLVQVEYERSVADGGDGCPLINELQCCPLPLPELDLDHYLVSTFGSKMHHAFPPMWGLSRRKVVVEPFTSSSKGDFILRYQNGSGTSATQSAIVVRRSRSDFEWLHEILKSHKRPGHGHLCGRILPPFPSKHGTFYSKGSSTGSRIIVSGQKDVSERAIDAAKSSVGMITSMAKSLWGNLSPNSADKSPSTSKPIGVPSSSKSKVHWLGTARDEDVPLEVAHRIERYLNYLLENPALSTSFPLNAILKASQSGLESAKQTLQEHAKQKKRQRSKQILASTDGKTLQATAIWSALVARKSSSLFADDDDTPWLRTAAQVAMALQFHGILETTGHESTSAKIQHASLPRFGKHSADDSWDEDDNNDAKAAQPKKGSVAVNETCFESGVIRVDSDLGGEADMGGYDLLPPPGPSETHHVLNAGCDNSLLMSRDPCNEPSSSRFVYDTASARDQPPGISNIVDATDSSLGPLKTDDNVDKVRDIIRSVDITLGKLHSASDAIRSAQQDRNTILLGLLRDVDSWGDIHGEVVNQRSLVSGVEELETFNASIETCNKQLTDDLAWQSSLATSAFAAVNEVRNAVRASNTASRAKSAALTAAQKAKNAYESCDISTPKEEIQSAQAHASNTQSQAIHAAVVEYEANTAKRRAAVGLAHDIRCWNVHRKKSILDSCIHVARLHRDTCRKTADTWENLRDGLIESSNFSIEDINQRSALSNNPVDIPEYTATILYPSMVDDEMVEASGFFPSVEDHYLPRGVSGDTVEEELSYNQPSDGDIDREIQLEDNNPKFSDLFVQEKSPALTSITAPSSVPPILEAIEDSRKLMRQDDPEEELGESFTDVYHLDPPEISLLDDHFSFQQAKLMESIASVSIDDRADNLAKSCNSHDDSQVLQYVADSGSFSSTKLPRDDTDDQNSECSSQTKSSRCRSVDDDDTTTSMQSLIDGLMSWGGTEADDQESDANQED